MPSQRRLTVLLAEDDPGDRIPIVDYLISKGLLVVQATTPDQTIRYLEAGKDCIDVVVLDLVMPEGYVQGGEDVLANMDSHGILIPVILATAWGYNGPAERLSQIYSPLIQGRILTKTFLPSELHKEILDAAGHNRQGSRSGCAAR